MANTPERKFKVGDTVRCIVPAGFNPKHVEEASKFKEDGSYGGDENPNSGGAGWKENLEFKIASISDPPAKLAYKGDIYRLDMGLGVYEQFLESADALGFKAPIRHDEDNLNINQEKKMEQTKHTGMFKVGETLRSRDVKNTEYKIKSMVGRGDTRLTELEFTKADNPVLVGQTITVKGTKDLKTEFYRPRTRSVQAPQAEVAAVVEGVAQNAEKQAVQAPVTLQKHEILGQNKIKNQLEIAAKLNIPVLLVGDTGTGKTTVIKELAEKYKQKWIRFNLTGDTTVDEFVGKYTLVNKQTVWEDGILLTAMKSGKWLIVDEINVALPEILFVLHSLLDDDRNVTVVNHQGEVVTPHKDFRFFGTMNPVDEYAGTKDLNKAFKSRFGMILNVNYPSAKVETKIVAGKGGVTQDIAAQIVDVGQALRQAKEKDQIFYTCSTRDLIQWASLVPVLGLSDAFEVALLNKANGDRNLVSNLYQRVTGQYVKAEAAGYELNIDKLITENERVKDARRNLGKEKAEIEKRVRDEILGKLLNGEAVSAPAAVEGEVVEAKLDEPLPF
jgi:MoxR-like ATPase